MTHPRISRRQRRADLIRRIQHDREVISLTVGQARRLGSNLGTASAVATHINALVDNRHSSRHWNWAAAAAAAALTWWLVTRKP